MILQLECPVFGSPLYFKLLFFLFIRLRGPGLVPGCGRGFQGDQAANDGAGQTEGREVEVKGHL